MPITELADADGHVIEPGDLWVERLPEGPARRWRRASTATTRASSTSASTASTSRPSTSCTAASGRATCCRTWASPAPWACRSSASSPTDERERYTILDAPALGDGRARAARVQHRAQGVSRAVLFPTFMLAGGTFLPHIAPAVCQVYNDWILDDYCAGSGGRLIPVAALPTIDVDAAVAEVRRVAELGFQVGVHPHQPGAREEVLRPELRPAVAGDRRHRPEARPPSAADVGPGRHVEGLSAAGHHGGVVPRLPDGHDRTRSTT